MSKFLKNINLWLALVFFLSFFSLSSVLDFSWSKNYFQHKVQNSIYTLSDKMDVGLASIHGKSLSHSFSSDSYFEYLIFQNDSLVFWSDQKFPSINLDSLNPFGNVLFQQPGIYFVKYKKELNRTYVCYANLQNNFAFENEYLKNKTVDALNLPMGISFTKKKTDFPLVNRDGETLVFLNFNVVPPSTLNTIVLILTLIAGFIFLISWVFILLNNIQNINLKRAINYPIMGLIFIALTYSSAFGYIRQSSIFQPESFAFTAFLPSMMSLLWVSLVLFFIFLFETKWAMNSTITQHKKWHIILVLLIEGLIFNLFIEIIQILANNTPTNLDLANITSLNINGVFGIIILVLIAINFIMVSNLVFINLKKWGYKNSWLELAVVLLMGLLTYFLLGANMESFFNAITLVVLYGILILRLSKKALSQSGFYIVLAVLISYIINYNLVSLNQIKEQNKRQILIQSLALNQDPEVEYLFGEIETQIYEDSLLRHIIQENWLDNDEVSHYILEKYFSKYKHWRKYDFQITVCDQQTNLLVKPSNMEVSCGEFFYNNLISSGRLTSNNNLYRLDYGSGQINYLGLFRFYFKQDAHYTIYVEINSKIKRKGFTKLLSPSGFDPFEKIRNYSLAKYNNNTIVESYGDYTYPYELKDSLQLGSMTFLNKGNFNHLYYKLNNNEIFVLSKPIKGLLSQIAPFAYLFILIIITTVFFLPYLNRVYHFWFPPQSFSFRLQMSFISLLAVSLLVIAFISTFYIKELNHEKDAKALKKTAFSLQTEFEHKLANTIIKGDDIKGYLNELSIKFSKVFNADINLYSLDGNLISTTKPELYDYHFISTKINPKALNQLREEKNTYLNFEESIGSLNYYSAYMPFHDADNVIVAYLNLPYFAQQDQLKKDVSSFVMTLMNVYTFMIVISILLILLLSNYIIRPLKMIKEMMQKIRIGKKNEYIVWNRKDEIGDLVVQYNHMVDELAKSADFLAKSERESAWRQMARQVAHEIKNPLTPMKLSVQYLLKSLDDGKPDLEVRLRKLSTTLIEQIDALAAIATAFSDFAKMPVGEKEKFNLKEAIEASIKIFEDYNNITITFTHQKERYLVFADKKNLIRVFNNLIKNAIQSIPFNKDGFIDVDICEDGDSWKLSIKDNGSGIPLEQQDKIFIPNFTTKSGGMGLGLAMVRNIILSQGGNIDFETEVGKGTTFYIYLKIAVNE